MSENWQKLYQRFRKLMSKFITTPYLLLGRYLTLMKRKKEEKELSKLLNFENLKAKTFYEILNSQNLQLLNPLKSKVSEELLQTKWYDILEKYYRLTDESKYLEFINNLKKKTERQNRMVLVEVAFLLHSLGIDDGTKELEEIGIKGNLKSKVFQERTKYRMFQAKEDKDQQETSNMDYYEILGDVVIAKQVNLNPEMFLTEWVGILKSIRKQNEWQNRKIRSNNKGSDR